MLNSMSLVCVHPCAATHWERPVSFASVSHNRLGLGDGRCDRCVGGQRLWVWRRHRGVCMSMSVCVCVCLCFSFCVCVCACVSACVRVSLCCCSFTFAQNRRKT